MTPYDLICDLRCGLAEHLKSYKLPPQNGQPRPIKVMALKMPANPLDEKLYPLVFIELNGVQDNADKSIAQVLISVGTYSTDELINGQVDLLNIMQEVRMYLLTHQLIGAASINYPLSSIVVESDSAEFFFAQIVAEYRIGAPTKTYLDLDVFQEV